MALGRYEKDLWQHLKKLLPMVHWQRIELSYMPGIPDLNGCYEGVEIWIELKVVRRGKKINLTRPQVNWIKKRTKAGGRTLIMVLKDDQITVWPGEEIDDILEHGIDASGFITAWPITIKPVAERLLRILFVAYG